MQPSPSPIPANSRKVSLFRNGVNQALRILREFELPSSEALLIREGNRLIIEAFPSQPSLLETLASMEPLDESLPDVDATLPPAESIDL
ncbi:MAG: hypothetical protein JJT96_06205 [Opitutales bacterium]|nr:hypothetical protein [Opitutales bacterium]